MGFRFRHLIFLFFTVHTVCTAWEIIVKNKMFNILLVLDHYFAWIRIPIRFAWMRIRIKVWSGSGSVTNFVKILDPDPDWHQMRRILNTDHVPERCP